MKNMEICKHDEYCGGCVYQGMEYSEQLNKKEREVLTLLEAKGIKLEKIDAIEGCPAQYRYRNKMEYTFGDFTKGGEMTLGMHRKGNFMSVATVDECQLVDVDFNRILRFALDFARERGYAFYHKKTHTGLLRNLIVRKGQRTGELLVNIVTASDGEDAKSPREHEAFGDCASQQSFDEDSFVKGLLSLKTDNKIVGILRTFNDGLADAVVCQSLKTLWGRDYYMEKICGLDFNVSAFSFFQTNVEAVERLYTEALSLIDDLKGKNVFDLYCGTGTISQIMASKAKSVLGVELVPDAVEAARKNAALNGLGNCRFIAGDVFEVLDGLHHRGDGSDASDDSPGGSGESGEREEADSTGAAALPRPDVIVVDPPRAGIQPKALDKILGYGVRQILYISCNPKTLVENLKYMEYYGYRCEYLKPFDNFPFTTHCEVVSLLQRMK